VDLQLVHVFCPSIAGERFYLRTLLTIVKGAKDWKIEDFMVEFTYKPPVLLEVSWRMMVNGSVLQRLETCMTVATSLSLSFLLCHNNPSRPAVLWDNHKASY